MKKIIYLGDLEALTQNGPLLLEVPAEIINSQNSGIDFEEVAAGTKDFEEEIDEMISRIINSHPHTRSQIRIEDVLPDFL